MTKEAKKKTINISGKNYTLQNPGIRWYIKHADKAKDAQGNLSNEKYIDGLLENVVLEEVKIDDFVSITELRDLIQEIESFLGA